ncbi:intermembrane lipid transfer protein VPS13D isoform X2 [Ciona intestinalis]
MLEKYAAQVLNHYIGKYVQNFNPANLSIGLLQGDVELEDLLLRQDALKELELPGIELVWGCIGKISLNIPSYKNYSEPWVIEIHNLNLVLSPCKHSDVLDELTENQQEIDNKYKQLTAREEKWHASYGFNRSIYGIWQAYSSSIVTKILQNLQVRVYNVHVRYEDETTCPTPFAFGLHVDSLLIQSTNENWQPNPTNLNSADKKWKLVHLSNMSLYWDTNARFFGHDMQEIKDLMMNYKADLVEPDGSYASKYIVNPVNSEAKFIQDLSSWPLRSDLNPRLSFTMDLQLVALQLSKSQYNQMLALGEEITRWNLQHCNRVGRPTNTIIKNPRTWWRWAIMKHLSTIKKMRERRKKEFICRRVKLILCYVENYQKLLNIKYVLKTQDNEVSDVVCQVEEELSLNELLILREIVYDKLDRIRIAKKQQEKTKLSVRLSKTKKPDSRGWGWHGWFGNWGQTNEGLIEIEDKTESTQPVHDQQKSVYEELDDRELYEMFGEGFTEKETNDSFLRRDNVLLKLNFNLDKGSITVYDDTAHKCLGVVDLQFNRLQLATQWRPRTSTYTMQVDLGDVVLKDLDKINKHYSNLVKLSDQSRVATTNTQQLNMSTENKKSVFSLFYEKLPMLTSNSSSDRLRVSTASLCITCIPGLMERLKKFISKPDTVTYAHHGSDLLTSAARQKYVAWKQHTQHEISNTVKRIMDGKATKLKEHRWEILLDICAPEIILPENISDPNTKLVVFNLGHIKFSSDVASREDTQVENIVPMVDDSDSDDDDDFSTPLNSPPPESTVEMKVLPSSSSPPILSSENEKPEELNENIMMEKMYERFHLSFSNLQVMVTQRNMEWWNVAKNRGRHEFHFIEPFTVDLEIQRRVVNTNDPLYPAVKVAGKLPHLTLHISDMKVRTIRWCFNQFISKPDEATKQTSQQTYNGNIPTTNLSSHEIEHALSEQLQCDFKINQVSVILEKDLDNQFIAVLQINRVQTIFSRRPFDASAELSIYSLLLVDVMQQLGKDFELLLASHRNVYLDVDSGQILDSGATSPDHAYSATYPVKQNVSRCASEPYTTTTHVLTKAAQNLEKSVEYLIQVQLQLLKHGSPHKDGNNANEVTIVNAKFNNLDAVFNVSSWTKLLSFLHNLFPQGQETRRGEKSRLSDDRKLKSTAGTTQLNLNNDSAEIHVNFDFKKLNLLLLRHVHTRDKIIGRKVATVTLQAAKFVGNIENERGENGERQSSVVVNGSVESLQVQDLTMVEQGTWKTQGLEIFNIGDTSALLNQYDDPSTQKAFLFNFITGKVKDQTTLTETVASQSEQGLPHDNEDVITHSSLQFPVEMKREELQQQDEKIESKLEFEVALFCYIHCPRFVAEILALVDEVNNVTDKMMTTATRQAYKDMARTIMDKVSDYSMMGKTTVETPASHPTVNPSTTTEGDKNKFNFLMKLKSPFIALPKYAGSYELLVANLGRIIVKNKFLRNGEVGTLSSARNVSTSDNGLDVSTLFVSNELEQMTRSGKSHRACVLDVIHVTLVDMDLYTALHHHEIIQKNDNETLVFPSYTVVLDKRPLLTQKVQLKLQLERNLEKEITHNGVPDTALSAQLSSVDCKLDHTQYWLIRGVLDHNVGEAIPDFPQPTAFLQPSELQTVLTGDVYTQLSLDVTLTNVSIELLKRHATSTEAEQSLGRLDFLKSVLEYRALSNNTKTANLSCEAFRAHDTRWTSTKEKNVSLVTVVLGPTQTTTNKSKDEKKTSLQFELFQRSGPNFVEFIAVLNSMRVIVILDWLLDMQHYILDNPDQERFIALKEKTAKLMAKYGQQDSGNQQDLDNSGQLNPVPRNTNMRLSITETEFVMFENLTCVETDAIILRSTAVIYYAPDNSYVKNDLPFRCSLERLEIFSCQLNNEKETALSIIDPVTLSIEVRKLKQSDLLPSETINNWLNSNILDVYVPDLNMRVSFNDVMLILAVFKSLPMQLSNKNNDNQPSTSHDTSTYQYTQASVVKLVELGYSNADVIHALSVHCGDEELSMRWLMEHATLQPTSKSQNKELPLHLSRVCCHIDTARLCLIDDCGDDCDVPLAEFTIQQLVIKQLLATHMMNKFSDTLFGEIGSASFKLSAEYYNRVLSLWEPFIDPWRCVIEWKHIIANHNIGEWWMKLDTSDRFDLSVTSTLIETIKKTHSTWIQHYVDINNQPATQKLKTRNPFVPYILRNLTGCQLSFVIKSTTSTDNERASVGAWKVLEPGKQSSFHFALFHEKQRHKRTPLLKEHQIRVKVGEWKELAAVTVSRVGVFFRHAVKEINKSSTVYEILEPVRVVFSITLVGSAQKVITVRSALVVQSKVKVPVQLQLDGGPNIGVHTLESIPPGESQYIPLQLTSSHIRVRPKIKSSQHHFSSTSVTWSPVTKSNPEQSTMLECPAITSQSSFFFSICIQREDYPSDEQIYENLGLNEQEDGFQIIRQLPGHTIIILPTITVSNLLPCDLYYYVKNEAVEGTLKPGLDATPHTIAVQQTQSSVILGCLIENFKTCRELVIPSNGKNFQMRMLLKDHNNATLILNVRILWRYGCSVRISVMAGYWIVNKTGLPILVKQDGTNTLAAGQHEAHEEARSLQPLLFSYADRDQPYLCTMRVGKKAQIGGATHGQQTPWFCEKFSTDGGSCTRNLRMITSDGTPNREFCIGISVRRGWGRYMHTHIVTVAPRFLLLNNTKHNRLSFAQRHTISNPLDPVVNATHLTIIPGSSVVFHWPRVDRDTLLCVRLADEPMVRWSGGFLIDRTDAFHIPLRLQPSTILYQNTVHSLAPHCIFLNIEVTLNNATYTVCVSDADPSMLPPPLRVDNISSAPIIFNQFDTKDTIEVDAESQVAYACDEPCKPQKLQCQVKGSHVQAVIDMNDLDSEKQLYYDNYIYISVGSTKHNEVLVFDVVSDDKQVVLQPLQRGKRSQLWRMKSDGRIFHEGSAPPTKKIYHSSSTSHKENYFVLDISEMAIKDDLGRGIPLSLKRKDERRNSTQTWWFEDHGRLHCLHKNLCVQAKELKPGSLVVLASFPQGRVCLPHELCERHKHIPGSGVLSLKVVRDGPTRVLRIVDIRQKRAGVLTPHKPDWTILQSHTHNNIKFHTNFSMMKGIGVSLVNNTPEELIYITMNGVTVDMSSLHGEQSYTLKMQKVQIDNQLMKCQYPVMLSARQTSSSSTDPLVSIHTVTQASSSRMYGIYKSLNIDVGRLSLQLEEQLLLKLLYFIGYGKISSQQDTELLDETKVVEMNTSTDTTTTTHRYYFEAIRLSAMPVQLSVFTASRLSPELKAVKQALNLTLVQFERAPVIIKSYSKHHVFENISFILKDVTKFLRDQMMGQAAMILGSVDFLGNPIGLLSDVKAGVTGLAKGNFQNMIMHFTHGVSNSTAKVTSSLSKGLGGITMDDEYDETRRMIQENAHDAGGHVVAGVQGLMAGVIGGITSVITQPVRGAQKDGAKGFFKGIAKGVIGTVTKPVTGMLDLASESASAVREISVTKEQQTQRVRPTRCCHSFQGCLQSYSFSRAKGQQVLYSVNRHDFSEHFYADSTLSFPSQENVLVMITSKKVYFINGNEPDPDHVWLLVGYDDLVSVQVLSSQSTSNSENAKLELTIKSKHHGIPGHKKPQVTCHSKALAERVCERINFAKSLFNERSETLCYGSSDVSSDRSFDLDV